PLPYALSLHDALPIYPRSSGVEYLTRVTVAGLRRAPHGTSVSIRRGTAAAGGTARAFVREGPGSPAATWGEWPWARRARCRTGEDRKSTRLNSSHVKI